MTKISDKSYHNERDGVSASLIKEIYNDPELYLYNKQRGIRSTSKQMRLGSLVHTLILEPEQYESRYLAIGSTANTKAYKEAVIDNPDKTVITIPEEELAVAISANNHDVVELFSSPKAMNEIAILGNINFSNTMINNPHITPTEDYNSKAFNIKVKGKVDCIYDIDDKRYSVYDLKTTSDINGFERDVFKYGYDIQAGFYSYLLSHALPERRSLSFFFVVIETKPPYKTNFYECTPGLITQGKDKSFKIIDRYLIDDKISRYQRPHFTTNLKVIKANENDHTLGHESLLRHDKELRQFKEGNNENESIKDFID